MNELLRANLSEPTPAAAGCLVLRLLDADASGLVELDEFVTGCLNLHGRLGCKKCGFACREVILYL